MKYIADGLAPGNIPDEVRRRINKLNSRVNKAEIKFLGARQVRAKGSNRKDRKIHQRDLSSVTLQKNLTAEVIQESQKTPDQSRSSRGQSSASEEVRLPIDKTQWLENPEAKKGEGESAPEKEQKVIPKSELADEIWASARALAGS